ncbi:MAG: ribonuclease HIII [Firmicutes bacterium]|nr:ribonuclease HIII [Bacillota bacterium]
MLKYFKRGENMTIVFKISDNLKDKLIEYYKDLRREKTPPYAVFQAQEADTIITLYESGKVMFQGISADIDANIWIDLEKKYNNRSIDQSGKEKKTEKKLENFDYTDTMGSDEVGTGDFFGPIIVTATYVTKDKHQFLHDLKVGDSKKLTDDKILQIAPLLIEKIPYSTFKLSNQEYNEVYNKDLNMNKLKAIFHNKALVSLHNKGITPTKIVVDQFVNPKKYFEHLQNTPNIIKNITFTTKAEDKCLSVACASIISRYYFLKEMTKMSQELNLELPKGAGITVDEIGAKIAQEKGFDFLKNIAKLNFQNTNKIKEILTNKNQ